MFIGTVYRVSSSYNYTTVQYITLYTQQRSKEGMYVCPHIKLELIYNINAMEIMLLLNNVLRSFSKLTLFLFTQ
jgi:hypothetical protein